MKKGLKTFLSILGALALIGAAAGAAYQFNDKVRSWVDSEIAKIVPATSGSTDNDGPAETVSSPTGSLSAKIYGGTVFGAGGIEKSVAIGSTKTIVYTVSPANATDKYVIVSSSDTSKVTVSPAKVLSGQPVTLTLVIGQFNGTVNVTAYPEALSSAVVTVPVTAYNFVTGLALKAICLSDGVYNDKAHLEGTEVLSISPSASGFAALGSSSNFGCLAWDLPTKTVTWFAGFDFVGYLTMVWQVTARDSSIRPSAVAGPADTYFDTTYGSGYYLIWHGNVALDDGYSSIAAAKSIVFEEATYDFSTGAYVAPTGVTSDSGTVVFD